MRDVDADVVYEVRTSTYYSINLNLELTTVAAQLEPREELHSAMHPGLDKLETCHRFNTWMQLPQVDSPMYHQHQKFVDRIAPLLLESFLEQQQCDDKAKKLQAEQVLKSDAQATTQSPSNDEPSAKRSRGAAGGSDF